MPALIHDDVVDLRIVGGAEDVVFGPRDGVLGVRPRELGVRGALGEPDLDLGDITDDGLGPGAGTVLRVVPRVQLDDLEVLGRSRLPLESDCDGVLVDDDVGVPTVLVAEELAGVPPLERGLRIRHGDVALRPHPIRDHDVAVSIELVISDGGTVPVPRRPVRAVEPGRSVRAVDQCPQVGVQMGEPLRVRPRVRLLHGVVAGLGRGVLRVRAPSRHPIDGEPAGVGPSAVADGRA